MLEGSDLWHSGCCGSLFSPAAQHRRKSASQEQIDLLDAFSDGTKRSCLSRLPGSAHKFVQGRVQASLFWGEYVDCFKVQNMKFDTRRTCGLLQTRNKIPWLSFGSVYCEVTSKFMALFIVPNSFRTSIWAPTVWTNRESQSYNHHKKQTFGNYDVALLQNVVCTELRLRLTVRARFLCLGLLYVYMRWFVLWFVLQFRFAVYNVWTVSFLQLWPFTSCQPRRLRPVSKTQICKLSNDIIVLSTFRHACCFFFQRGCVVADYQISLMSCS